jgi:hypothetical protein
LLTFYKNFTKILGGYRKEKENIIYGRVQKNPSKGGVSMNKLISELEELVYPLQTIYYLKENTEPKCLFREEFVEIIKKGVEGDFEVIVEGIKQSNIAKERKIYIENLRKKYNLKMDLWLNNFSIKIKFNTRELEKVLEFLKNEIDIEEVKEYRAWRRKSFIDFLNQI